MQDFLQYGDKKIEFTVVYKKRKTIGLSISVKDGLKVFSPKWVSKKQIRDIVEQKAEWILKKLSEFADRPKELVLESGAELLFLGFNHKLEILEDSRLTKVQIEKTKSGITISSSLLPLTAMSSLDDRYQIHSNLVLWYKKQAETIINLRINELSEQMQVKPSKVTIRHQKTRWGSCSSKGAININWRLVMMPLAVIDYVLVHELAHLKHLDHSKNFWNFVQTFLPDFQTRKLLLKEYAKKINLPE